MINMKQVFFLYLALLCSLSVRAQKCLIMFGVYEEITINSIESPKFSLLFNDSIPVSFLQLEQQNEDTYHLEFDYRAGKYTIRVEADGHETAEKSFTIKTRRNTTLGLGNILMKKERSVTLGEATVRATRIKMVTRGDTLVYDAAAFELADGSMLDALVAQLPGAELKNGQIKVNGKFIESLMVNGEDFFAGNPKIALENLPAYTVKNIKVYDRAANDDYLRGKPGGLKKAPGEDEHMVMDVILKKAYSTGWLGNAEGGYGLPDDRYLGKAFGMGYTGKLRVAAFANLNNIKNTQSGGSSGQWNGGWAQDGELDVKMGGLDYLYSHSRTKILGNVTLTHEQPEVEHKVSTVSFFDSGDVYGRSLSRSREKKFHLLSSHQLQYSGDRVYLEIVPSVDYLRNDYKRIGRSAQFTANPQETYRLESLDSLFALGGLDGTYAATLLNRTGNEAEGKSDWLKTGVAAKTTVGVPDGNDTFEAYANGNYRRDTDRPLTSYNRIYGPQSATAEKGENILQDKDYMSKAYTLNAGVSYKMFIWPYQRQHGHYVVFTPKFDFTRNHYDQTQSFWQQHTEVTDASDGGIVPPSTIRRKWLTPDPNNTYHSVLAQDTYRPGAEIYYIFLPNIKGKTQYDIVLGIYGNMRHEHLQYDKQALDTTVTRWANTYTPSVGMQYKNQTAAANTEVKLNYDFSQSVPSIYYQLGTINDADPLNIYINTPDLHRAVTHNVNAHFFRFWIKSHRNLAVNAAYSHTDRAVAQARLYDRNTGVSTWLPQNIDGNWNASGYVQYTQPFGKNNAFQLQSTTGASFVHSVDYATDTETLERSVVNNRRLSEQLSLTYRVGRHSFGIQGGLAWLDSRSKRASFENISAFDITAGANFLLNLPKNWQIGSDATLYCRRGYSDGTLNTTHLVWNGSLSKSILKERLTFKLDGVDILGQISNVQHVVNAQGRTETWMNTLPRYAMLHVIWRFNVIPKKKD